VDTSSDGQGEQVQPTRQSFSHQATIVQHSRLTVALRDTADTAALAAHRTLTNNFDVLAVQPLSDRAFASACSLLDVDIIVVDCSQRSPFRWRVQQVREALSRGIHFEICYTPMLRDQATRRMAIANAVQLVRMTGGKGIIISSGALNTFYLRGPLDVAYLATLFGMSRAAAREAMLGRCQRVLRHGEARRAGGKRIVALASSVSDPHLLSDEWPDARHVESEARQAGDVKPMDEEHRHDGGGFLSLERFHETDQ